MLPANIGYNKQTFKFRRMFFGTLKLKTGSEVNKKLPCW